MKISHQIRTALIVLLTLIGASISPAAYAESGGINLHVVKGGWILGASGGSGTLYFHGHAYPLSVGGVSVGFVFGASVADLHGRVSHIRSPYDVAGTYGAAGGGVAVGVGARGIVLTNEKGAVLTLAGGQAGLMVNADLSGLIISMR